MSDQADQNSDYLAEIILYLGHLGRGQGSVCGLTHAQWSALRYFSKTNQFSRTVSAFADYHVTTRGTASQTITSLVDRGLLERSRSSLDGRSSTINLTTKGRSKSKKDPFKKLVRAIDNMPEEQAGTVAAELHGLMRRLARRQRRRMIGKCADCRFRHLSNNLNSQEQVHICQNFETEIEASEIDLLCINYMPAVCS